MGTRSVLNETDDAVLVDVEVMVATKIGLGPVVAGADDGSQQAEYAFNARQRVADERAAAPLMGLRMSRRPGGRFRPCKESC